MEIPDVKAAVDKEWKKLETIPAWQLGKVKKQEGGYSGSTLMDECHLKNAELNQNFRSIKVESYSEETLWKTILVPVQYLLNKVHQLRKWLLQKSWISYPDYQTVTDEQPTRYLLTLR